MHIFSRLFQDVSIFLIDLTMNTVRKVSVHCWKSAIVVELFCEFCFFSTACRQPFPDKILIPVHANIYYIFVFMKQELRSFMSDCESVMMLITVFLCACSNEFQCKTLLSLTFVYIVRIASAECYWDLSHSISSQSSVLRNTKLLQLSPNALKTFVRD